MTWDTDRKQSLPADWGTIRKRILTRDNHRCTWTVNGQRCREQANQVDHIGSKHDHSDANLRSLCEWHHRRRTSAQGNRARKRVKQTREPEQHPGMRT